MHIVVIDGTSGLFNSIRDDGIVIIHKRITRDLATGGRYSWNQRSIKEIRKRKLQQYLDKCVEIVKNSYPTNETLYLAGISDIKTTFRNNLPKEYQKLVKMVDVQYGGDNGFHQARQEIEMGKAYDYVQPEKIVAQESKD